jgi:parallel beta-helix repeat protein
MKKKLELFAILLTIIFSTLTLADKPLFPIANATYVEGWITQDTVWTLVDSPFVVSKDVTIRPDVTLTIEPEVEVRFGGDFSLIVEGRLVAQGTEDKMITFTSNSDDPEAGDWGTINFAGEQSSLFVHCLIEYGTNGITVGNGVLTIQNSLVANNAMSGIYIAGDSQVQVQYNNITSSQDGITLAGNLTSEINIQQNRILLNSRSGILLAADAYDNTLILNNAVSGNHYGFYVSTNTTTFITRNYISNNTVGIFYAQGNSHTAYFNDVYDNSLGMDVSVNTAVNAERNYWGDKSGPYHESLNPHGMGNPVAGDGVDLDFIFFLTASIDYDNTLPTAILWTDKTLVAPNQNVTFIGTDSYDDGRVDQYFFDFGDGTDSSWTTLSLFNHSYSSTGTYNAKLTVMDDFGVTSDIAEVLINVQNLAPLEASVTLSNHTVGCNEQISVTVYVSDGISAVENATVTLFSVKGGDFTPLSGVTNSAGYFTATFTSPNVTEVTNVRIIARTSKAGYADGSDHKYLKVLPPLTVQVTAEPVAIKSEETATVNIHVTVGFEQSVAEALLILSSDYGNLSAATGVTDVNGSATFIFTAPQTLNQINVTITATAIKMEHTEGFGQGTLIVDPKILVVEVTADPAIIVSETVSTINARVTFDAAPISNATVTVSSDSGGSFSTTTEITDLTGNATFVFTAPQATMMFNAAINLTAAKNGYVNGEEHTAITIVPRVLSVQATAEPSVTVSERKMNVTVQVTYAMNPLQDANVTIKSEDGGYFSTTTGLTNSHGNVSFIFTAPPVNTPRNITIIAQASKIGYVDGEHLLNVTVNPGILSVDVVPSSSVVNSTESTVVTVHVKCNGAPVANASVTMSSSDGNFSVTSRTTDSDGRCIFVFNAPKTMVQLSTSITANATKNGYISEEGQTTITVIPETLPETGGGWPITTILLIIIPIAIVVIVLVLIKLKIITLSVEEE